MSANSISSPFSYECAEATKTLAGLAFVIEVITERFLLVPCKLSSKVSLAIDVTQYFSVSEAGVLFITTSVLSGDAISGAKLGIVSCHASWSVRVNS